MNNARSVHRSVAHMLAPGSLAVVFAFAHGQSVANPLTDPTMRYAELTGSSFVAAPRVSFSAPAVRELVLPQIEDGSSIWGATGRDSRGHIWVGISAESPGMSAHLFEYDPVADTWHDHGSVVDRLKAAGLHREGEGQIKIHSKVVPGGDGWLYFASTDEEGEKEDGSALPCWGRRLWRIHPKDRTWEHLCRIPDHHIVPSRSPLLLAREVFLELAGDGKSVDGEVSAC